MRDHSFVDVRFHSISHKMIAFASGIATLITYPFDLLRTRFAMQGHDRVYHGTLQAFMSIHHNEGTRGIYRGVGPSLLSVS